MSYQVLARKWRPRNFKELVGQEHVQRALINALDNDRLHHAFLFTGTRGVGKTTIARILAKSLNCETGVTSTPCGQCSACAEINEGRFVDLIEVDAASRTKVEDTRELLENVQYAPTRGRYKVYLIDEVHMLSTHSFNALLKTLEEPPLHVKFLLATTDPQKLPVTILSRCLQFNLKRLPVAQIQGHLQHILSAENIPAEAEALTQIAKAADGSMRDALSLLDQAIAYGSGRVRNEEVRAMLGTIEHHQILDILQYLAGNDAQAVMQKSQNLAEHAFDFAAVLDELITQLHHVALAQISPQSLDAGAVDVEKITALAASLANEDVQLFYQIALIGRRDLALAPDPRLGFEMVLLRMLAFKPADGATSGTAPPAAKPATAESRAAVHDASKKDFSKSDAKKDIAEKTPASPVTRTAAPIPAHAPATETVRHPGAAHSGGDNASKTDTPNIPAATSPAVTVLPEPEPRPSTPLGVSDESLKWHQLVERLNVAGITRQLALNCSLKQHSAERIELQIAESRQQLLNATRQGALQQALQDCLGANVKLSIDVVPATDTTPAEIKTQRAAEKQHDAEQSIYNDQTVKTLINTFDAQVAPGSIVPVD